MYRILAIRPGEQAVVEVTLDDLADLLGHKKARIWVDLASPVGETEMAIVRDIFKFHGLAIEDCFETRTHPKIDEYDDYLYLITHGLTASATAKSAEAVVELDAFLGTNYLVTHHSQTSRSVAAVREQIMRTGYPLRLGPTAVLHAILERQTDGLEEVLDNIEEEIGVLEEAVFQPRNNPIAALLAVKRNIVDLRRWMGKQRDVLLRLGRREFELISPNDALQFRDVHDHLVRLNDMLESFREMLTSIQDAHLSAVANRTNEIMKFLTLFSSTLIPLTVLTGLYGMNFEHMPELRSVYGYPMVLGGMAVMVGGMLLYFRHRGWLGHAARVDAVDPAEGKSRPDEPKR